MKRVKGIFYQGWKMNNYKDHTLKDFYQTAMRVINQNVSSGTAKDRIRRIERHVIPTLGNTKIRELTPLILEQWQYNLFKTRGADQTRRCKALLKNILNRAIVYQIIDTNPITATVTIREPKINYREVYTKEEIKTILNNAKGWLRLFILTMVSLGLRSGEATALKFTDINWRDRTIKIQRAIRHNQISKTKTGTTRVVDIPSNLFTELVEYQKDRPLQEYLFVTPNGTYYKDSSHIVRRHFKPLLERLGIEYKSLYSLRHTYATISLQGGQTIDYIADQLGHKDTSTTFNFYIKYLKNNENKKRADNILSF